MNEMFFGIGVILVGAGALLLVGKMVFKPLPKRGKLAKAAQGGDDFDDAPWWANTIEADRVGNIAASSPDDMFQV